MRAAIIQSSFLPWKGYFDIIHEVDVFVFLEDVQYTKHDWRSRNRVKTPGGSRWLSVPVKGGTGQRLCDAKIDYAQDWMKKHLNTIHHSYAAADYYHCYGDEIFSILSKPFVTLSALNIALIKKLSSLLGIETPLLCSRDMRVEGSKDDRLIALCEQVGANCYLSGPSARAYIIPEKFAKAGIRLEYKDYAGYPEYRQPWGPFDHFVSVIDLLFCCGEKAPQYIWGWRHGHPAVAGMARA